MDTERADALLRRVLVPERVLHERRAAILAATDAAAVHYLPPLDDMMFRHYLLFSDGAMAHAAGLGHLDGTARFYNMYYWYRRFAEADQAVNGEDAGLLQRGLKMLECAPEDVAWEIVEAIELRVTAPPRSGP